MHSFFQTVVVPGLSAGALYALIAIGFTVMFRVTGVLNFAHGNLIMLAPLGALVAIDKLGLPVSVGYAVAFAVTVAVALVEERIAIRPFLNAGSALPWIVSTLGSSVILAELMSMPYKGETRAFPYGLSARPIDVIGLTTTSADLALMAAAPVVAGVLVVVYSHTRLGLMLSAAAGDRVGATAIGIRIGRMSQVAAVTAALVAAVTGLLLAPSHLVSSDLGLTYLFYGFVAASLGGLGSLGGALVGGFAIGLAAQAAGTYVGALYVNLTLFAALLVLYLVRPYGLFGRPALRAV